ncbi:uncharacterized protein LOC125233079 [Leguminivora glycinivorella]|uniref:uncharacterized protein LOC125233079 n=1 Tax=Leguminivora glycinivorella TaxID=1035111 RepID=UPI00200EA3F0|nr:uncharacterized protein LOC125233079 [Leguminivora glycinivorella]XP_047994895.1 uncharacterized protein LOC125233079 [Leguminivora glycinivorella]
MPKRKREKDKDSYDYLLKKIKRLEKKLRAPDRDKHRDSSISQDESDTDLLDAWAIPEDDANGALPEPNQTDGSLSDEVSQPVLITSKPAVTVPTAQPQLAPGATANPAAPAAPASPPLESQASPAIENTEQQIPEPEETLDADLMEILGTDPNSVKQYGKDIQKDLSIRLEHCATNGLTKELRKEFKERYLTPDNCKLIDPPEMNAEVKAAVSDVVIKRDKAIENKQKQLTSAISCLSEAITILMQNKEKNTPLLKLLIDSTRILCDCQHADTITRRNFLLNAMKKEMKDQLQNTKIDKFLFSENLADTLKSAKAITKSGADLKIPAPKPQAKKPNPSTNKNLNWKPGPARRQPGPSRAKEPATSTSHRPRHTSRPSQHQQHYRTSYRHR